MDQENIYEILKLSCCLSLTLLFQLLFVIDTFFAWANIGSEQKNLTLGYCIGFIIVSTQYPPMTKNKYVMIPFYILVGQMLFSILFM